jgi:hypothetical protein
MEQRCFFNACPEGSSAQAKRVMLQVLDLDGRNSATRAIHSDEPNLLDCSKASRVLGLARYRALSDIAIVVRSMPFIACLAFRLVKGAGSCGSVLCFSLNFMSGFAGPNLSQHHRVR